MISLGAKLAQHAARQPENPAVTCGDDTLPYLELRRRPNRLAHGLAARCVVGGGFVVVAMPNGLDFVAGVVPYPRVRTSGDGRAGGGGAGVDEHPAVRSSAVIGLPDDHLGSRIHAIIEVAGPITEYDLLAHLASPLVSYKRPRSFEFVDEPLRNDAGKARRSAIRDARLPRPA